MLLALDTATASITVCVYDEAGDVVLASYAETGTMKHGELLAPAISSVLSDAGVAPRDLTGVAVGVGPGPYTGLRVGVVTAKTLGYVLGVPVSGVSTLDALALAAAADLDAEPDGELAEVGEFLVATDARRREVFFARYDRAGRRRGALGVAKPADVPVGQLPVAGRGAVLYPEAFPRSFGPLDPSAADVARLVARSAAELFPAEPIYLRRPDAVAQGAPKPVS